jgi:hypothetical protein
MDGRLRVPNLGTMEQASDRSEVYLSTSLEKRPRLEMQV